MNVFVLHVIFLREKGLDKHFAYYKHNYVACQASKIDLLSESSVSHSNVIY